MMSGEAQVMAMKPILRSFFSGAPFSWAIASSAPNGKKEDTAAIAAEEPTAFRKRRRVSSRGKSARITADSITRRLSVSALSESGSSTTAGSCSAWLACLPQSQPAPKRALGLNGFEKADMRNPETCCWCYQHFRIKRAKRLTSIARGDKSLHDKEFVDYFAGRRNAKNSRAGHPGGAPGHCLGARGALGGIMSAAAHSEVRHEGAGHKIHRDVLACGRRSDRLVDPGRGLPCSEGSRLGGARLPLSLGRDAAGGAPALHDGRRGFGRAGAP